MKDAYSLSEVAEIIAGQSPPSSTYNSEGDGVPFFQGKADFGELFPTIRAWCTEPKKMAKEGDILISVRDPVGPTNVCSTDACIGRGLSAIRAGDQLFSKYLLHYLRYIEPILSRQGVGSTFSAITQKDLRKIQIPLPPLEEQKRIASILDKADELRQKRKKAVEKLDELAQSIFLDMFGDPVTNPKGWEIHKFSSVGVLKRGKSKHRPRNAPELLGGPYPLIQTSEVANSGGYITHYSQTYSEIGLRQSRMWPKGTLCITIAANIAKTGILLLDACFPDSIVGFTPNNLSNAEYIRILLTFLQRMIEDRAPESAQKNINLKILGDLDIPIPPIDLQLKFSSIIRLLYKNKLKYIEASQVQEKLTGRLLATAFR